MTLRYSHSGEAGSCPVPVIEDGQNGGSVASDGCCSEGAPLEGSEVREEYVVLSARVPQSS